MKTSTTAACLAFGLTAAAWPGGPDLVAQWPVVDAALLAMGIASWLRRGRPDAGFPTYLAAGPAILVATLAGTAHAPHCIVSTEASLAGRVIAGGMAAALAWMAAGTFRSLVPVRTREPVAP